MFPGVCKPVAPEPLSWSPWCPGCRSWFVHRYHVQAVPSRPCWASQRKNTLFSFRFLATRCWKHPLAQKMPSAASAEAGLCVRPVSPVPLFLPVTKDRWLFLRSPALKVFTNFAAKAGACTGCVTPLFSNTSIIYN